MEIRAKVGSADYMTAALRLETKAADLKNTAAKLERLAGQFRARAAGENLSLLRVGGR